MRFWRGLLWLFAACGLLTCLTLGLGVFAVLHYHKPPPVVPDTAILKLDLDQTYSETADRDPVLGLVTDPGENFQRLVATIRHAALDPRVKGLVARVGGATLGLAQIQELRDAVGYFRARGKFAYAFGESFGDLGGGTGVYYLASAFDRIWLQPVGSVGLTGIALEMPFLRGLLDKLGVTADFSRRGDYKTAETELTATGLAPSDKAALAGMTQSLYDQIVAGIAAGRHLGSATVAQTIDGGPYMTAEALGAHLIDAIGYRDDMEHAAQTETDGGQFIGLDRYARAIAAEEPADRPVVALVRAVGAIVSGTQGHGPLDTGDDTVASDDLVKTLNDVARDKTVRAVVIRIDSPGGSEVASETIWHAIRQVRAAGKPVVVSMGDEAASGGYYIAVGADKIIAEPATLTGSIGVFGGKFVADGLWQKLGITWDGVQIGRNADIASMNQRFSPAERQRFEAMLDDSYRNFIARVADGRHMTPAAAEALAGGRVWTGAQAQRNGLVDRLGGLDMAVDMASSLAHLPAGKPVDLVSYPPRRSIVDYLDTRLSGDDGDMTILPGRGVFARLAVLENLLRLASYNMDPAPAALAAEFKIKN